MYALHMPMTRIVRLIVSLGLTAGWSSYALADEVSTSLSTDQSSMSSENARFTDWSVKWKKYPTSLPLWRASVTYVGASGPGEGLVASCGETGWVTYISKRTIDKGLKVSRTSLRTGDTREYQIPNLDIEGKFGEFADLRWLSCSADGSRIAVSYQRYMGKKYENRRTFIVDLSTLKVTALPALVTDRRFEINGRPISPSFNVALGSKVAQNSGAPQNVETFPIEDLIDRVNELRSPGLNTNFFLQDESVFVITAAGTEPKKSDRQEDIELLQFSGKQFATVKKCSIHGMRLRYAQPALSGLIITASNADNVVDTRPYYVKLGSANDGSCDLTPLDDWSKGRNVGGQANVRDIPGYAGDAELWASARFAWPNAMVDAFGVKFYLSSDKTRPVLSTPIMFRGVGSTEEQPLVWMPLSSTSRDQFTFVYGPHGANTAIVHIWKTR